MKQDEENVAKWVKEALPSAERMELARRRVLQKLHSESTSRELLNEPTVDRWPWRLGLATAAGIILLVLSVSLFRSRMGNKAAGVIEGTSASPISNNQVIRSDGGRILGLKDGSSVEMQPGSQLAVESASDGLRIRLDAGSIIVMAAKQHSGHLYVQTKDVAVSVLGTVFFVRAGEEGSRVAVIQGEVLVQHGTVRKQLHPGEQLATNPQMPFVPIDEEVSSSPNAQKYLGLLQQSVALPPAAPVVPRTADEHPAEERKGFEVVSVRPSGRGSFPGECGGGILQLDPDRLTVTNATLYRLIALAYGKNCSVSSANSLLSVTADWMRLDRFDIQVTIPEGVPSYTLQELDNGNASQLQLILQRMLTDRFKLVLHRETREMTVYALTLAKNAPRLPPPPPAGVYRKIAPDGFERHTVNLGTMRSFASFLSGSPLIHHLVMDKTGLQGEYEFLFGWNTDDDFLDSMQDQLGLRLESAKTPVEILVVDHAEKASEN